MLFRSYVNGEESAASKWLDKVNFETDQRALFVEMCIRDRLIQHMSV